MDLTPDQKKLYAQLCINEGKRSKVYKDTAVPPKDTIGIGRNLTGVPLTPDEVEYLWHNDLVSHPELGSPVRDDSFKRAHVNQRVYANGISDDEIMYLWKNDVRRAEDGLDKTLPWWRKLDLIRQRVLLDMCFNMGITKLLGFKNTLAACRVGNYKAAAAGMLQSLWADQVDRVRGDGKGRADLLAKMMETGRDYYC